MRRSNVPLRAVIDTNLFVSGTLFTRGIPFEVLEAWRDHTFRVLIAEHQLGELRDVFARPKIARRTTTSGISGLFARLSGQTTAVTLADVPVVVRDVKDEKILAAALGGEADYLVTGDADLLILDGDPRLGRLRIVTARAFLDILATDREDLAKDS